MRKVARLALVTGCFVSLFAGPAHATQDGPCANLGDVCYKIIYRPKDQICRSYDVCP